MATSAATSDLTPTVPASASAKVGLLPILMAVLLSTMVASATVAGGAWYLLKSGKLGPSAATTSERSAKTGEQGTPLMPPSHVLALDPMVVNLVDASGRSFLRASISLRIANELKLKAEKEDAGKGDKADNGASAALRDTTLAVLGAQNSDALLAAGGLEALKKKLRESYALQNTETHVLDVYVTDFLVQRG